MTKSTVEDVAILGFRLSDGTVREYICPSCKMWHPTSSGALGCLNGYHTVRGHTWVLGEPIVDIHGNFYHIAKKVLDFGLSPGNNKETDLNTLKDMESKGVLSRELADKVRSRIK